MLPVGAMPRLPASAAAASLRGRGVDQPLSFGVLADDHPVRVIRAAALQRTVDAGQDARGDEETRRL
jgi:hypothetical protein